MGCLIKTSIGYSEYSIVFFSINTYMLCKINLLLLTNDDLGASVGVCCLCSVLIDAYLGICYHILICVCAIKYMFGIS